MNIFKNYRTLRYLLRKESRRQNIHSKITDANPNIYLGDTVQIVGKTQNISIGQGSRINRDVYLNVGGNAYGKEGRIIIGENTIIGNKSTLFAGGGKIEIGDNCDIGVGVIVVAHSFLEYRNGERHFAYYSIQIADNTNISSGSIIIGNTSIGNNCVITPGAVVQGEFGDNFLITGNPARAIPRPID